MALNSLGALLLQRGEFSQAAELLRRSVRSEPGFAQAWYNLGGALEGAQKLSEATESYEQARKLDPLDADTGVRLAWSYFRSGRIADAGKTVEDVLKNHPRNSQALALVAAMLKAGVAR